MLTRRILSIPLSLAILAALGQTVSYPLPLYAAGGGEAQKEDQELSIDDLIQKWIMELEKDGPPPWQEASEAQAFASHATEELQEIVHPDSQETLLHLLSKKGAHQAVEGLLVSEAGKLLFNKKDHAGQTPFAAAVLAGQKEVVALFIKQAKEWDKETKLAQEAPPNQNLAQRLWRGGSGLVTGLFKSAPHYYMPDLALGNNNGQTPLWLACHCLREVGSGATPTEKPLDQASGQAGADGRRHKKHAPPQGRPVGPQPAPDEGEEKKEGDEQKHPDQRKQTRAERFSIILLLLSGKLPEPKPKEAEMHPTPTAPFCPEMDRPDQELGASPFEVLLSPPVAVRDKELTDLLSLGLKPQLDKSSLHKKEGVLHLALSSGLYSSTAYIDSILLTLQREGEDHSPIEDWGLVDKDGKTPLLKATGLLVDRLNALVTQANGAQDTEKRRAKLDELAQSISQLLLYHTGRKGEDLLALPAQDPIQKQTAGQLIWKQLLSLEQQAQAGPESLSGGRHSASEGSTTPQAFALDLLARVAPYFLSAGDPSLSELAPKALPDGSSPLKWLLKAYHVYQSKSGTQSPEWGKLTDTPYKKIDENLPLGVMVWLFEGQPGAPFRERLEKKGFFPQSGDQPPRRDAPLRETWHLQQLPPSSNKPTPQQLLARKQRRKQVHISGMVMLCLIGAGLLYRKLGQAIARRREKDSILHPRHRTKLPIHPSGAMKGRKGRSATH